MAPRKKQNDFIDDFDLGRIINKSAVIKNIINWLNRLVELDQTVDKKEVQKAIDMLKYKKDTLDSKAKRAQDELAEEAEMLASAYDTED